MEIQWITLPKDVHRPKPAGKALAIVLWDKDVVLYDYLQARILYNSRLLLFIVKSAGINVETEV